MKKTEKIEVWVIAEEKDRLGKIGGTNRLIKNAP